MKYKKGILLIAGWILLCILSFYCLKNNLIESYLFLGVIFVICICYAIKNRRQVFLNYKMGIGLTILACLLAPHHYLRRKWYTMARSWKNTHLCRYNLHV